MQNLHKNLKKRHPVPENQSKTHQSLACINGKNEIKQNSSDFYQNIPLHKLKPLKMLIKAGIILFIFVVAFLTGAESFAGNENKIQMGSY